MQNLIRMTDQENKNFDEAIKEYNEKLHNNKQMARQILYELGIITKRGKIRKGREGLVNLLASGAADKRYGITNR